MRAGDSGGDLVPTDTGPTSGDTAGQGQGSSCSDTAMKFLVQSAIVFFGTLIAAALVALGEPGNAEVQMAVQAPPPELVASLFGLEN